MKRTPGLGVSVGGVNWPISDVLLGRPSFWMCHVRNGKKVMSEKSIRLNLVLNFQTDQLYRDPTLYFPQSSVCSEKIHMFHKSIGSA